MRRTVLESGRLALLRVASSTHPQDDVAAPVIPVAVSVRRVVSAVASVLLEVPVVASVHRVKAAIIGPVTNALVSSIGSTAALATHVGPQAGAVAGTGRILPVAVVAASPRMVLAVPESGDPRMPSDWNHINRHPTRACPRWGYIGQGAECVLRLFCGGVAP